TVSACKAARRAASGRTHFARIIGPLEGLAPGIVGSSSLKRVKLDTVWAGKNRSSNAIPVRRNGLSARHGSWNGAVPSMRREPRREVRAGQSAGAAGRSTGAGRPDHARRTRAGGETNMETKQGPTPNRASETNALDRAMQVALRREERRRRSMIAA